MPTDADALKILPSQNSYRHRQYVVAHQSITIVGVRILLVEPDRELGRTLADALQSAGHDVMVKRDAQTGLDGLDHHNPELVILEIQLGKHNGIEFLYELHSHTDWHNIPIIIHTHNVHAKAPEFAKSWQQLDVKHVLYKPETSLARLKKTIQNL